MVKRWPPGVDAASDVRTVSWVDSSRRSSQPLEHLVLADAPVVAYRKWRGGDEAEAAAPAIAVHQVGAQGYQYTRHPMHETAIADQVGKLGA